MRLRKGESSIVAAEGDLAQYLLAQGYVEVTSTASGDREKRTAKILPAPAPAPAPEPTPEAVAAEPEAAEVREPPPKKGGRREHS